MYRSLAGNLKLLGIKGLSKREVIKLKRKLTAVTAGI